ncbi:hypothetical protein [Nocardia sp. NPDC057455]|uniref:hypothetical protein n=1 Tax=Nocardia sp. NPDC057455 TaxID=3346138 RepID=UPI0036715AE8
MMASDPLAPFFTTPVVVERRTGNGAAGPTFAPPVTLLGWVVNERRLVLGGDGEEIESAARVSLPATTPAIPVGSRVRLPDDRVATVLTEQRREGGPAFLPHYYSVDLT